MLAKSRNGGIVHVFVGPTAFGIGTAWPPGVRLLSPAARGDVDRLVDNEHVATLVLVDGVFRERPAVGHRELIRAIDKGWDVWGLSSMGALRARELSRHGMRGFGEVYAQASKNPVFRDDEVAVLHGPGPKYAPLSEALVNLRQLIATLVSVGALEIAEAIRLESELDQMWFGDRVLSRVESEVSSRAIDLKHILRRREWDVKANDLRRFIDSHLHAQ